jgi:hypothetical protein
VRVSTTRRMFLYTTYRWITMLIFSPSKQWRTAVSPTPRGTMWTSFEK